VLESLYRDEMRLSTKFKPAERKGPTMSKRLDPSWLVLESIENQGHNRCVDIFVRPDGSFGFEEFRRDTGSVGLPAPFRAGLVQSSPRCDNIVSSLRSFLHENSLGSPQRPVFQQPARAAVGVGPRHAPEPTARGLRAWRAAPPPEYVNALYGPRQNHYRTRPKSQCLREQ